MRTTPFRRRFALWVTLVLAVPPSLSWADGQGRAPSLAGLVTAGDTVTVTLWAGGKASAEVIQATDCALVLRTGQLRWTVHLPAIKTLRRHESRPVNPGAAAMAEVAARCDEIDCLLPALMTLGIGAAIQGIDDLAHPPKVVYRASRHAASLGACAAPGMLAVASQTRSDPR